MPIYWHDKKQDFRKNVVYPSVVSQMPTDQMSFVKMLSSTETSSGEISFDMRLFIVFFRPNVIRQNVVYPSVVTETSADGRGLPDECPEPKFIFGLIFTTFLWWLKSVGRNLFVNEKCKGRLTHFLGCIDAIRAGVVGLWGTGSRPKTWNP